MTTDEPTVLAALQACTRALEQAETRARAGDPTARLDALNPGFVVSLARARWLMADDKGRIGWTDDDGVWHAGLKPLPSDIELEVKLEPLADDDLDGKLGGTGHEPPPFLHGSLADLTARANAAGFPTVSAWVDHLEAELDWYESDAPEQWSW